MVSKKQKEQKKKAEARKKQPDPEIGWLRDRLATAIEERRKFANDLSAADSANKLLIRDLNEAQRKLKGRDKELTDMHNNHTLMRRSLVEIRELHMPVHETYDPYGDVPCQECGKRWPCATYRKINTPDHIVVSSLIEMERDLRKEDL